MSSRTIIDYHAPFDRGLKNCSNRGFSGLVVAWIILEVAISLHRGFMCELLISFIELEKQFILLNIFMKLRTRLRENKPNPMVHGLSSVLKCVVKKSLFFSGEKTGKLE